MAKHRTYSIEFKRQVVQEYLGGETLHGLSKQYDISRNLIRVWIQKYEAVEYDEDAVTVDLMQAHEARIASTHHLEGVATMPDRTSHSVNVPPTADQSGYGVVLLGDRKYEVERFWASLPNSDENPVPSQVAVDISGRVHFLQRANPAVIVFDPDGQVAFSYGHQIYDAHGIYCDALNRIFVADRDAHQIIAFDADGNELFCLGDRHEPHWQAPFNHPTDVAVAPDGRIFVADGYGNACVHRFAAEGAFECSWGTLGRAPGQFMTPHAIWVDAAGNVLVADRENGRVQRFTSEGGLIDIWKGLQNPMDIWVDDRGFVHVTDQLPSLVLFSAEGDLIGRCRPSLNGAHGLFGDNLGNIYLAEMNPASLTRMRRLE